MNQYVTSAVIRQLRESNQLTQAELAEKLGVSDKTISKWETAICPVCGNCIHTMGETVVHCHGILLTPCQPEETDENHSIAIEQIEDEYFIRVDHDMTKTHHISFIAALSSDRIQMVKLYPEGNAEARFKINGVRKILFYCNRDGLFSLTPEKNK